MDIKERIKQARKSAMLSQSQLAQALGISFMTIRRWESGEISPRLNEIQQLSKVLNISIEYLIGLSDDSNNNVMSLTQIFANDNIEPQKTVTGGIPNNMITVKNENTNITYTFPNNDEGRRTLEWLWNHSIGYKSPIFANSISGDNNSHNNLGIIQD